MGSPLADRFGRNLRRRRRLAGLSQAELAKLIQLDRMSIGAIERGLCLPRLDTILKLSAGIDTSPCELLAGMPRWRPGYYVAGEFCVEDDSPSETRRAEHGVA